MHGGKIHILNITCKIFFSINKNSSYLKWCHQHFWIIYRPVTLVLRLILNWMQSMNICSKIIKLQGHLMGNLKSHSTANLPRKSIRKELKSVMKLSWIKKRHFFSNHLWMMGTSKIFRKSSYVIVKCTPSHSFVMVWELLGWGLPVMYLNMFWFCLNVMNTSKICSSFKFYFYAFILYISFYANVMHKYDYAQIYPL